MMKNMESKKITALGVVIFSFISILAGLLIVVLLGTITSVLIVKTNVPEGFMKIGNVIGSCLGVLVSSWLLTRLAQLRGIISALILSGAFIIIKSIGNEVMHLGGYFSLSGLVSIVFIILFACAGSILGSMGKR